MHIDRTVLITLSFALVVLNCHNAELEDHHNLETSIIDAKNVDKAALSYGIVEKVQNNSSIDSKNKDNKVFGLNKTGNNNTETKETDKAGDDSTEKTEEWVNGKLEKGTVEPERKVSLRGEECGSSSNSCVIEDKALVACLRVPGNESPDLSLLIQNKGKGTATVTISAPEFVHVETNEIEVPENENKKMKVSIRNKGTETVMVLKSGNGNCSLDFKDLISQETFQNHVSTSRFAVVIVSNVLYLIVAGFLVIALLAIFIGLSRKRSLDMEFLPVSNGGGGGTKRKTIIEPKNDGWEDNWSDDWDDDDEEATKTSFNSSFSQDVISSRRINKDGWKD